MSFKHNYIAASSVALLAEGNGSKRDENNKTNPAPQQGGQREKARSTCWTATIFTAIMAA